MEESGVWIFDPMESNITTPVPFRCLLGNQCPAWLELGFPEESVVQEDLDPVPCQSNRTKGAVEISTKFVLLKIWYHWIHGHRDSTSIKEAFPCTCHTGSAHLCHVGSMGRLIRDTVDHIADTSSNSLAHHG